MQSSCVQQDVQSRSDQPGTMMIVVKGMSGVSEIGYRVRQDQPLRLLAKHFAIKQGRPDAAIAFKHQDRILSDYAATLEQLGLADGDVLEAGSLEDLEAASGATLQSSHDNIYMPSAPGLRAPADDNPEPPPAKKPRTGPATVASSQDEVPRQDAPGEPQERQAIRPASTADNIRRGGSTPMELCGHQGPQAAPGSAPGASNDIQPAAMPTDAAQQDQLQHLLPWAEGPGEERVRALLEEHARLTAAKEHLSSQLGSLQAGQAALASRAVAASAARAAAEAELATVRQETLQQRLAEVTARAALHEHEAAVEVEKGERQRLEQELSQVEGQLQAQRQQNDIARQAVEALQDGVDARAAEVAAVGARLGAVRAHDLGGLCAELASFQAAGTLPQAQEAGT